MIGLVGTWSQARQVDERPLAAVHGAGRNPELVEEPDGLVFEGQDRLRLLGPGRQGWDLADKEGRTVAQQAARFGHLPPSFDRWDLLPECYRPRA